MPSLRLLAKRGTYDEFMARYEASQARSDLGGGSTLLHVALGNGDPGARVAICHQLLDDGADAAAVTDSGTTVLHVLLAAPRHDFRTEAALVTRLLNSGADVNRTNPEWGPPLRVAVDRMLVFDPEAQPLLEAIIAHGSIDWTVPVNPVGAPTRSLGKLILETTKEDNPLHQAARADDA